MKIVFTNDIVYAYATGDSRAVGGAERQQWLLARELTKAGLSVTVGVRHGLAERQQCEIDGMRFIGIGSGNVLSSWHRFLAAEQPDWWGWVSADHLWGIAVEIAKQQGVQTVFFCASDREVILRRSLVYRRAWWPMFAWGLHRTDLILVQHAQQLAALPKRWHAKADVLPCITEDVVSARPHRERDKYIVWASSIRKVKRVDRLFEIVQKASTHRFVVCGSIPSSQATDQSMVRVLESLAELSNVTLLGQTSPEETREIIGGAAILLSTSDQEGFPSTFLEAWAAGTPVVSVLVDPDGVIQKAGLGIVSGTVDQCVRDLDQLMSSCNAREEICSRARRYVGEHHSAGQTVRRFQAILDSATRR